MDCSASVDAVRRVALAFTAAMAADQRRARVDRRGSEGGEVNCRPRKMVHKTKRLERVERAMEIRAFALKLLGEQGRWTTLFHRRRYCSSKTRAS